MLRDKARVSPKKYTLWIEEISDKTCVEKWGIYKLCRRCPYGSDWRVRFHSRLWLEKPEQARLFFPFKATLGTKPGEFISCWKENCLTLQLLKHRFFKSKLKARQGGSFAPQLGRSAKDIPHICTRWQDDNLEQLFLLNKCHKAQGDC